MVPLLSLPSCLPVRPLYTVIRPVKPFAVDLLTILFPQVRAQVLRLLFADASAELHLRELTRCSGLALGTIQTELAKLSAAQLVVSERDGNRLYYRANAAHPLFPTLRQLVRQTTAPGIKDRIAALASSATPTSDVHSPSSLLRPPSRDPKPGTPNRPAQPATLTLNEFD